MKKKGPKHVKKKKEKQHNRNKGTSNLPGSNNKEEERETNKANKATNEIHDTLFVYRNKLNSLSNTFFSCPKFLKEKKKEENKQKNGGKCN